ncbi:MAG: enoyl-CoA hydratase-related protein [Maledivibacter sp.]|jgi:2,4-dienoyl-CoA reductase (NADPH2)|nr:enoyl-CoA hydratase-related protein [Maledivibacter sp.]
MVDTLFKSVKIGNLELKNRLFMLGMHTGYARKKRISERDLAFYKERVQGGVSAITVIAAVNDVAGPPDMHFLDHDKYIEEFKELSNLMHEGDCKLVVQLFHTGRNNMPMLIGNKQPVAPSAVPSPLYKSQPRVMTKEDIENTIEDFGNAALRAKKAGVDAVEISCSVGYLLTQFLSPKTNLRTDEYGGSEENRIRFPKEVIGKIREKVGSDFPIILRISAADMLGGYGVDFMQRFTVHVEDMIDAVNVTGGWHEAPIPQMTRHIPYGGYDFLAEAIKKVISLPVIVSNRVHDPEVAANIIKADKGDIVGLGRQLITDPYYPNKVRNGEKYRKCQACNQGCIERVLRFKDVKCVFNPEVGKETIKITKTDDPMTILIVGGGPAGMEAARVSALKGHNVILCEKEGALGGKVVVASKPPHKETFINYIEVTEDTIRKLDVEVRLNTKVTGELIKEIGPDHVFIATGSSPIIPPIDGINGSKVVMAEDVLLASDDKIKKILEKDVLIIGGGIVGLETAEHLISKLIPDVYYQNFKAKYIPKKLMPQLSINPEDVKFVLPNTKSKDSPKITVAEMTNKLGKGLGGYKWIMTKELKTLGVNLKKNTKVISINENDITLKSEDGIEKINANTIILAAGYTPLGKELTEILDKQGIKYDVIGDAKEVRKIMDAHDDAFNVALKIKKGDAIMSYGTRVNYEKKETIGIVTLSNPPLNLVDEKFFLELEAIQKEIYSDKSLRTVIIVAEGQAFSAGIDLKYLSTASSRFMKDNLEWLQGLYSFWQKLPIPVIAAVHGYCIGSAVELIAGVDLRVAGKSSVFALPEVQLGLSPDMGGTTRITKLVGLGQAKRLVMACDKIDANEAYRIGLVEYLVEDEDLEKFAMKLAGKLANYPPSAVRFAKKGINVASDNSTEAGLLFEQAQSIYCSGTHDIKEGISSFIEKRKPSFKDE